MPRTLNVRSSLPSPSAMRMTSLPLTSINDREPFSPAFARETRNIETAAATTIRTTRTMSPTLILPGARLPREKNFNLALLQHPSRSARALDQALLASIAGYSIIMPNAHNELRHHWGADGRDR